MQFLTYLAAALAFATVAVAAPGQPAKRSDGEKVRVGFSLDLNGNTPISSLSCAATFAKSFPQFHKLGDLPTAPFYGEVPGAVDGSPKCGSCIKLQYGYDDPIYMIAVDNAKIIQLSKAGFEKFAGAEGLAKGTVNATAAVVSPEFCHLW